MLSARLNAIRARAASQRGFTLIELLVAMAAGMVVISGMVAIMIVTMHQQQVTFTKIDATRKARLALATVENELHSACVDGSPPVQVQSTPTKLIFLSYSGNLASPTPVWHELTVATGKLTDTTYAATHLVHRRPDVDQDRTRDDADAAHQRHDAGRHPDLPVLRLPGPGDAGDQRQRLLDRSRRHQPAAGGDRDASLQSAQRPDLDGAGADRCQHTVEVLITLMVNPTVSNASNPGLTNAAAPVTDAISLRLTTPARLRARAPAKEDSDHANDTQTRSCARRAPAPACSARPEGGFTMHPRARRAHRDHAAHRRGVRRGQGDVHLTPGRP